ncbi:MAG: flagellar hook-length control protein FliK [Sedimentibacter sp.]|uniref:flagellar hook-length control protein FliK n=1 Tax=Sedimentibacter sp. TaxID=1960295 RepID=UPI0029819435|nr:flagellar hook-length control protein FliK [Sedimentibacter sp.]MDW5298746.1 flagellar hook-length control protein FliK [Sedimentibacter sp.]
MNMNVNMNLNNMLANQVQNNAMQKNSNLKNSDDGLFMNMLNMLMTQNSATDSSGFLNIDNADSSVSANAMELLLGNNIKNFINLDDAGISDDESISFLTELNKEEKTDLKDVNNNLTSMISGYNFINSFIKNSDIEAVQEVYSAINSCCDKNIKNISFINPKAYGIAKDVTKDRQQSIINQDAAQVSQISIKGNEKNLSSSAEKLILQIESDKNKFKKEFNYQVDVTENKPVMEENNKIIEVSDESSQIKSSVLSQVKDKIVFMTSEGTEGKEGTKQVTMELNPENMGKVDIKMIFENNKITVEIKASNEETHKILSSNAEELTKALNKNTEASVNVTVKPHEHQYGQNPLDYNSQNNGRGRQRNNNFYYSNESEDIEEDGVFSQIINLRTMKLSSAV